MKDNLEKNENSTLFEGLFQNIFQIISKIPQLLLPNKKMFAYTFVISWMVLIVLTVLQIIKWFFGQDLKIEVLVLLILIFLVFVLIPILISMFTEWERRNNYLRENSTKILENKEQKTEEK